ncbi:phage holin [Lapidilactobacillus bayanensis]|uniref:phage holin n=1 Tax=Lapidilactobacillus bayanensis TaxID=2485998 RepID=UPI000F794652|nr:phage holin [Lapidilactobacillus bayanensis]
MKLPNKVYDSLKWALTIVAPASIVLIKALGAIYHFDTDAITATIAAVATFAGSLFMISSTQYKKEDK